MGSPTGIKRVVGLALAGALLFLSNLVLSESTVTPGSKAAGLDACVAPTEEIRRYHMLYLTHDRVETVRKGVRGSKNSLAGCVDCHAAKDEQGQYLPVNGEGQFCDDCHNYTAVTLACFQCHRKTPDGDEKLSTSFRSDGGSTLGLLEPQGALKLSREELARLHAKVREE